MWSGGLRNLSYGPQPRTVSDNDRTFTYNMETKEKKISVNPNLAIYEEVRSVPAHALRTIESGPLKGKSDVNPMFRIQILTRLFGPVGFGWYTEICRKWTESTEDGSTAVFVDINLYVRKDGEWSKPIHGTGGNKLVTLDTKWEQGVRTVSPHIDDEAYKKAYTDALSVACKSLGIAADVYWAADVTKYSDPSREQHGWGIREDRADKPAEQSPAPLAAASAPDPADRKRAPRRASVKPAATAQPEPAPDSAAEPVPDQMQTAAQAPAVGPTPEVKLSPFGDPEMPVLYEGSRAWAPSVTRIIKMSTVPTEEIRTRIRAKYYITDEDFAKLMKTAGREL